MRLLVLAAILGVFCAPSMAGEKTPAQLLATIDGKVSTSKRVVAPYESRLATLSKRCAVSQSKVADWTAYAYRELSKGRGSKSSCLSILKGLDEATKPLANQVADREKHCMESLAALVLIAKHSR